MINTDNFSEDLKRALAIALPPPQGLELIENIEKLTAPASVVGNSPAGPIKENSWGNKGIYIVVGIFITVVAYGVYKEFIASKQNKVLVPMSNMEMPVTQPENLERDDLIFTDSNNSTQNFFVTPSNNS